MLYFAFSGIDLAVVWEGLISANFWLISASLFLAFLGYISRAIRWKLLIEPLGYKPSNENVYHAVSIAYFANIAFPRMGEVTRCATLNRTDKVPIDSLLGTVIIERATDAIILLVMIVVVVLSKIDTFGAFFMDKLMKPVWTRASDFLSSSPFISILFTLLFFGGLFALYKTRHSLARFVVIRKIFDIIKGISKGLTTVFKMKRSREFILHTVIIWVIYWAMTYLVCLSFEATSHFSPIEGLFMLVIGGIGMIIPMPGGIGSFHLVNILALTSIFNLSQADAAIYATLSHEPQTLMIILMGTVSLVMLSISKRKIKNQKDIQAKTEKNEQ